MTTEQHMLTLSPRTSFAGAMGRFLAPVIAAAGLALLACAPPGCASEDLRAPRSLTSPYGVGPSGVLWAVAPLANESGVGAVDPLLLTDSLVYQVQQVRGINATPLSRTLAAMRALGLESVTSPSEARLLAETLGADAILVGSITAWDPYDPPEIGLSLALYGVSEAIGGFAEPVRVDPRALAAATTDMTLPGSMPESWSAPASAVAAHLDGANHEVQTAVRVYAEGRHEVVSALGWRRYLASMTLFTEFACSRVTEQLLDMERLRIAREAARTP